MARLLKGNNALRRTASLSANNGFNPLMMEAAVLNVGRCLFVLRDKLLERGGAL
jgi:hypothetical protein